MRRREFIAALGTVVSTWLLPVRALTQPLAQSHRMAIVWGALVTDMNENSGSPNFQILFARLRQLGLIEGQNLSVQRYSFLGLKEPFTELAADVVRQKPDLIYANTTRMVRALKEATTTIPIVGLTADPLAFGLVTSLARPGGNVTGVSTDGGIEYLGRQLGLLRDLVPKLSRVGYLASRAVWGGPSGIAMREAGQRMGTEVLGAILDVPQEAEYRRAFTLMKEQAVDGLVVSDQGENFAHRRIIAHLADESRLPTVYPFRAQVEVGGLINYGVDLVEVYRQAAEQIAQIVKGAKPADLPIRQATKFEMVINIKTAKALGITIPPMLLARADEVIE
jgi:putative tryptophan/tyrosine transport system substrate-binding protein